MLSPFAAETFTRLYAGGAWEVVVEPARLMDLLAALASAREFYEELAEPVRREGRVDAIIRAIRNREAPEQ